MTSAPPAPLNGLSFGVLRGSTLLFDTYTAPLESTAAPVGANSFLPPASFVRVPSGATWMSAPFRFPLPRFCRELRHEQAAVGAESHAGDGGEAGEVHLGRAARGGDAPHARLALAGALGQLTDVQVPGRADCDRARHRLGLAVLRDHGQQGDLAAADLEHGVGAGVDHDLAVGQREHRVGVGVAVALDAVDVLLPLDLVDPGHGGEVARAHRQQAADLPTDELRESLDVLGCAGSDHAEHRAVRSDRDAVQAAAEQPGPRRGRRKALGIGLRLAVGVARDAARQPKALGGLALALALLATPAAVGDVHGVVRADRHAARVVEPLGDRLDRRPLCTANRGKRGDAHGCSRGNTPLQGRVHLDPISSMPRFGGAFSEQGRVEENQPFAGSIRPGSATGFSVTFLRPSIGS